MVGYQLEVRRNHDASSESAGDPHTTMILLGDIDSKHVVDSIGDSRTTTDDHPSGGAIERVANAVRPVRHQSEFLGSCGWSR